MIATDFSAKIEQYKDTIFRVAYSYCNNVFEAQDVSQEVFVKLYTQCKPFKTREEEKAWLIRITINYCKDLKKSSWHRRRAELNENSAISNGSIPDDNEVFDEVMALPQKYRTVIHLYYYEEYPIREIAALTQQKDSTVQTQLQRARAMLKKQLGEAYDYE